VSWHPEPPRHPDPRQHEHHGHERPHHPPPGPGPFRAGNGGGEPPHYETWRRLEGLERGVEVVSADVEAQGRVIAELHTKVAELSAQLRDVLAILRANAQG
jgi:hypothetical protein